MDCPHLLLESLLKLICKVNSAGKKMFWSCISNLHFSYCCWQSNGSFTALNYVKNSLLYCVPMCSLLLAVCMVTDWHVFSSGPPVAYIGLDLVAADTSSCALLLPQTLSILYIEEYQRDRSGASGLIRCIRACCEFFSRLTAGADQLRASWFILFCLLYIYKKCT